MIVSLDVPGGLRDLAPADTRTPEAIFERKWADLLLGRAVSVVRREYDMSGRGRQFQLLKNCLTDSGDLGTYADIAASLGTTEAAVKMSALRLRRRFAEAVRAEVSQTVAEASDVEDEMHYLLQIVTS